MYVFYVVGHEELFTYEPGGVFINRGKTHVI